MTAPDLTPAQRSRSLAEQAYRTIREGIATGKFKPGQRVTERDLAARLDVSPTPVREALRRLEQESLIERVSIRTLRVVDHSPETLRELMLTGAALRALEARFATEKISDAALDRMEALVDRLGDERDDSTEQLRIAREFDAEIEQAADNRTLRNLVQTLAIIGTERRTRSVETMRQHPDLARRRLQGHRAILVALRSRDPDLVEEVFRRHATAGVDLVLGELD
ncbi:GntR family transcriptional regulator [Phaeacidiphilus oryzae]|uniref:GntR family transcriptional regulator n=1 Tax=Phaeacidiphilus oryzae TaxID=348818 RepID=UPI00068FB39F|nr:GntR family transcriptional regulator [Phaeacidiphilus oryzae]